MGERWFDLPVVPTSPGAGSGGRADSKFSLARAVCDEAGRSWATILAVIDERRLDPLQVLLVQSDATVVRFAHDDPLRAALRVGTEAREAGDMLTRWRAAWEGRTTALMGAAQDQGLLAPAIPPERLGRHAVAMMLGHQAFVAHLPPSADDPWARMGEWWVDVLSQLASADWLAGWYASGWHERVRPGGP